MPWDPLRDIVALQDRLSRVHGRDAGWTPPVDVFEKTDAYVVTAELPGLSRDDIQIELHDGELTIHGQRPDQGVPPNAYQRMERLQGRFSRAFVFGEPIDAERINAEFRDGVLTITLPKAARPELRRIDVV